MSDLQRINIMERATRHLNASGSRINSTTVSPAPSSSIANVRQLSVVERSAAFVRMLNHDNLTDDSDDDDHDHDGARSRFNHRVNNMQNINVNYNVVVGARDADIQALPIVEYYIDDSKKDKKDNDNDDSKTSSNSSLKENEKENKDESKMQTENEKQPQNKENDKDIEKKQGDDQNKKEKKDKNEREQCRICLENFQTGDQLKILPCLHKFHARPCCRINNENENEKEKEKEIFWGIDQWLKINHLCPLCHVPIENPDYQNH